MTSQCAPVVMVADRARAKTVMAALDRRISILDFVGQSWAVWTDKANLSTPDGSSLEECSKNVKKRMETMTLKKEDMSIYGHCPAHDDFFLVVCSHCGQVVKPQAFEKHCERRHGLFGKLYGTPSNCSPDRPQQSRPPSQHGSLCEGQESRQQGAGPPRVPPPHSPPQGHSKPQREGLSVQQVEKVSHVTHPSPPKHPPKTAPPSAEKTIQKSLDSHGPKTYSRIHKKVHKKECDLDKHCGVMDPERKKLCTRLLTCNIHSIHQRRQVVGRCKPFDQLVMELKMSSKPRERPPLTREVADGGSAQQPAPVSQIGPLHYKCQITNSSILRSVNPSEGAVEMKEEVMRSEETQLDSLSASEESDGENREDFAHLPASPLHPKPLGLCTFGARVLGRSVLAFDRRLLHLRSAFSVMMEQHLSAYLWKKLPQVSELCSHQQLITANTCNSHNAACSSVPVRSASTLRTSTSGQSAPTNPTATSKLLPKGPRIPAGRTNKQTLQSSFRELQESPTASKRRKSPKEDKDSPGQSKILFLPHQSCLSRTASSPYGLFNGSLSPGSKPHPPETKGRVKQSSAHISSPSPESERGGASGLSQRAVGFEHKGSGRKRKTSGASPPKNTSCAPKANVLSSLSQTQSSLVSWGGDGRPGPTAHSLPKKLGAHKPKLLH